MSKKNIVSLVMVGILIVLGLFFSDNLNLAQAQISSSVESVFTQASAVENSGDLAATNWVNPSAALTNTNDAAYITEGSGRTDFFEVKNLATKVPSDASISGIEVCYELQAFNVGGAEKILWVSPQLTLSPGSYTNAVHIGGAVSSTKVWRCFGGATDTWGRTWTPAEINNSNFGAMTWFELIDDTEYPGISIYQTKVKVWYTPSSPPPPPADPANCPDVAEKLNGWAWSSNVGWIKTCNGLTLGTDSIMGYMWSPNIGWVNFNPGGTPPSGSGSNTTLSAQRSPSVAVNDTSGGQGAWSNPNYVVSSDSSLATVTLNDATSNFIKATGFNFSIPSSATVAGVKVEPQVKVLTGAQGGFGAVGPARLVKGGVILNGVSTITQIQSTNVSEEIYYPIGGESDLWGTNLTPADVNNSGFGVAVAVSEPDRINTTIGMNHIRMTVYYTLGGSTQSQTSEGSLTSGVKISGTGDVRNVTGWARACSVFESGCSGTLKSDNERGGWDGWIKMYDDPASPQRARLERKTESISGVSQTRTYLKGFAWGALNLGWIRFDAASDDKAIFCTGGACGGDETGKVLTVNKTNSCGGEIGSITYNPQGNSGDLVCDSSLTSCSQRYESETEVSVVLSGDGVKSWSGPGNTNEDGSRSVTVNQDLMTVTADFGDCGSGPAITIEESEQDDEFLFLASTEGGSYPLISSYIKVGATVSEDGGSLSLSSATLNGTGIQWRVLASDETTVLGTSNIGGQPIVLNSTQLGGGVFVQIIVNNPIPGIEGKTTKDLVMMVTDLKTDKTGTAEQNFKLRYLDYSIGNQ